MLTRFKPAPTGAAAVAVRAGAVWPYLVVFGLGCLAYAPFAGIYFLKDDLALSRLTDAAGNPSSEALVRNFLWPSADAYPQIYRPVPILFGWFDLKVFGADPAGFRICNIGFHGLNGVLLALLFNQLTGFRRPAAGFFCGALFALHPLHGEAVLWVTQRMVVLCATFSLLALIGLEAFLQRGRKTGLVVCVLASVAAGLSKEVTVALPAVMVVLAFLHPAGSARSRIRRTLLVALPGAALAIGIMLLRRVFFGSWVGTYTNLTPSEYAVEFHVFERLPRSLLDGFWSVNSAEVSPRVRIAFGVAWLLFLAFAFVRIVPRLADAGIRRALAAMITFALGSFLPTILVFYVEPTLFNGRFLYQPLLGVLGLLLLGFTRAESRRPLMALAAPAALAVLFALAGQLNLGAFAGADTQIRTIRGGIEREVRRAPGDPIVVAYRVPTEHHGVPTLDLSLAPAMRPPFTKPPGIDVVPLVAGLESWWPAAMPDLRARLSQNPAAPRGLLHLVIGEKPFRVSPLLGALDPPQGRAPPEILAPADRAILIHPQEEPTFAFQPSPGAARYRIVFAGLGSEVPFDLDPNVDLRRSGTRFLWGGEQLGTAWKAIGAFPSPVAVSWSLEAFDRSGRSLGRSATRAMVILTPN